MDTALLYLYYSTTYPAHRAIQMQGFCNIFLIIILFVCTPATGFGDDQTDDWGETIKIAVGSSIEPFMLKSGKGLIGTVVIESFQHSGERVEFSYNSNQKALELFNNKKVDGVTVVREGMVQGFYSAPLVSFDNHVISLASSDVNIETINDLKNYRIIAFSKARQYLGADFDNVVEQSKSYREMASQELQVKALFDGETDIIISDTTIFEFYRTRLRNRTPQDKKWRKEISIGFPFPNQAYYMAFQTESHQQLFNHGLSQLKASGRYQQIAHSYAILFQQY